MASKKEAFSCLDRGDWCHSSPLMDFEFSIVSDILFITKHKNYHNFGPNLNIDKQVCIVDMLPWLRKMETLEFKNIFFRNEW